jgi:nucleotide-binding universal stress UspA family protein
MSTDTLATRPHSIVFDSTSTNDPSAAPTSGTQWRQRVLDEPLSGGILLATDGSDRALDAARLAVAIAQRDRRPLQVVAVVEPLPLIDAASTILAPPLERARTDALHLRVRDQLRSVLGSDAPVSVNVDFADPSTSVARLAKSWGAALVVVGLGRAEPMQRLLGGGEALRMTRRSPVPVLAVAPGHGALPHTAVAAVDFADSSDMAAWAIASLLEPTGNLHLLHATPQFDRDSHDHTTLRLTYEAMAGRLLRKLELQLESAHPSLHVTTMLTHDHAARAAVDLAVAVKADVIAVGRHGHGPIERFLVGNVAAALLRSAPCSVLVAPAADDQPTT